MSRKNPASLNCLGTCQHQPTKLGQNHHQVVMVVHQPRYSLFTLFDEVLLLGLGGETVYLGASEGALPYFRNLGFKMPEHEIFGGMAWCACVSCCSWFYVFCCPFCGGRSLLKKGEEVRKEATTSSKVENKGIDSLRYHCMDSCILLLRNQL